MRRRLRWRLASARGGGAGRGARSPLGPEAARNRGRARELRGAGQLSRSPPPGTWPRRAVQVRAGGRREGRAGGSREEPAVLQEGLLAQVSPSRRWAEVPGGLQWAVLKPDPRRVQRGFRAPRVLPVPTVTSWDTASPSPWPRWKGPGLWRPWPVRLWELSPPSGGPGQTQVRRPKGLSRGCRCIPRPLARTRLLVLPLALSRTQQSRPSGQ